jgi:thymidylate kinase/thymidylate synthase ThyX
MARSNGLFIVIEGTDGSGKGTQSDLLAKKLQSEGRDVIKFDFPQYAEDSSYFIRRYLNGEYGSVEDVGPYTGSMFYALDRYEAAPKIRKALEAGKIVIANRFTGSNMAHQGTKFDNVEQRRGYFIWLDQMEFEMFKIPRPDLSLVLRVPADIAQKMVDKKEKRSYTDKRRDLHEADINHLKRSVEVYDNLCQLFPKDFKQIDCTRNGEIMSIETIHRYIWTAIEPLLPNKTNKKEPSMPKSNKSNKYVDKSSGVATMTEAGKKYLEDKVTSLEDDVYSFYEEGLSPVTVAAAMARLSRRGDDMRITLLDEFTGEAGKDKDLLKRVITAYGDDSVQQLVGQHVIVENASNLLTKKLEWGRLAAYLEQSTRYIYFDQRDKNGKYRYYTPQYLKSKAKKRFEGAMDQIFDHYSEMVHKLTEYVQANSSVPEEERDMAWRGATRAQACDAIRPVLPVATKSTVGIYASGQALESLIMHLIGDDLPEARTTGQNMLKEARKTIPTFLERADKPGRGGATIAYHATNSKNVGDISDKYLSDSYSSDLEAVKLTNVWPKNELDVIPDILYDHSHKSLDEIKMEAEAFTYEQREEILKAYIGERLNRRHKPGRALEKIHYSWDILCDYGIFRDLQRHRIVDDLNWQKLTPRYGYEIPSLVEEAGLGDLFEKCFDISLDLYSFLQSEGYALEAQYATLLGHKMRWKMTFNAREAFHLIELRTSPQGHPGYRKIGQLLYDNIKEVHPLLASAMKFVNSDEDPELTRLAAEKYTQFKLKELDKAPSSVDKSGQ